MIYTARQLEDLHKATANGQLVLPYGARLTPLAADWIKSRKVNLGFGNVEAPAPSVKPINGAPAAAPNAAPTALLWWCDGPCGVAKAALTAQAKESPLAPIDHPHDAKNLVKVIKHLATEVKTTKAGGGVLLVHNASAALVLANRCPSLRAIVGTSLETVEQGVRQVAANVLVIEYPQLTLSQVKNTLGRFARASRTASDELKQQLQELASCG